MVTERIDTDDYTKDELASLVGFLYDRLDEKARGARALRITLTELVRENERIVLTLKRFFEYLDYTEESDGGKMFHPITVTCCRAMMIEGLNDTLRDMKEYMLERTECEDTK